jgi:copper chaperone CopZ
MTPQQISTQHLTLPIGGMTRLGCVASVQLALSNLPGVQEVAVDLQTKQAQVTYNPAQVEPTQLADAVGEAGYTVNLDTPANTTPKSPNKNGTLE